MAAQLQAVFSRMQNPLVLRLHVDGGDVSAELRSYMDALAAQTELLRVEEADASADDPAELPFVEVVRADGTPSGLAFHGVPGGHEFTSFVLGLYNAAGPGQPIADADRQGIADIARPVSLRVLVGLSCTMRARTWWWRASAWRRITRWSRPTSTTSTASRRCVSATT